MATQVPRSLLTHNLWAGVAHVVVAVTALVLTLARGDKTWRAIVTAPEFLVPETCDTCLDPDSCARPATCYVPETLSNVDKVVAVNDSFQQERSLYSISLGWVVVVFATLTATFHFLLATAFKKQYLQGLSQFRNRARWIEYMITASIMTFAIANASGIRDAATLNFMFFLTVGIMMSGYAIENGPVKLQTAFGDVTTATRNDKIFLFGLGTVLYFSLFTPIITRFFRFAAFYRREKEGIDAFYDRFIEREEDAPDAIPWFVYAIVISLALFYFSFAVAFGFGYQIFSRSLSLDQFLTGERIFIWLSFASKLTLSFLILFGVFRDDSPGNVK